MEKNYAGIFAHGALLVLAGALTLFLPFEYVGAIWLAVGLAEIAFAFGARGPGHLVNHATYGGLSAAAGYLSFRDPRLALIAVALTGGLTLTRSLGQRYPGWRAFATNGTMTVALGAIGLYQVRHEGTQGLSFLCALELFTRGKAWLGLAWRGLRAMIARRTMARPLGTRPLTA